MTRVLVIQGAGMNLRGKTEDQIELFGNATLEDINNEIYRYAKELRMDVEIFQSNFEQDVITQLSITESNQFDAAMINPAGYTQSHGRIPDTINKISVPVIEVHISNPPSRGVTSEMQPVCEGSIYGFGIYGYYLALNGINTLTG
jgi:3-dehydroquinate dehydratase-2